MNRILALAIDGPAGAGKSTIAKSVSRELGWPYVDTGAMFRAIGLYFMKQGISRDDKEAVDASVDGISISLTWDSDGTQHTWLNGEDVSGQIRTQEVSAAASAFGVYPSVRTKLLNLQRDIAAKQPVVMDGRDIGTVVLPDAEFKVYLTAGVKVRALRRYKEFMEKGVETTLEKVEQDVADRDYQDMHRPVAPLKQAEDAVLVDSSDMTLAETEETILALVRKNTED